MKTPNRDFACWMVRRAARAAPAALRERLEEEWLADLNERRGSLARARFGIGCWWATHAIARDFARQPLVASGTGGNAGVLAFGDYARSWLPRRPGAMLLIIAFHVLVILAFTSSLITKGRTLEPPSITVVNAPAVQQPESPPERPGVVLTQPKYDPVPTPHEFEFKDDPPANPPATGQDQSQPAEPSGNGSIVTVHRVQGGPGAGFPATEDYYPAVSKQLSEQGAAAVNVCVDIKGRLTGNPTVLQSTGSARLDAGALRLAQAGSGHYRPSQENGQPVAACYAFRIRFTLRQ